MSIHTYFILVFVVICSACGSDKSSKANEKPKGPMAATVDVIIASPSSLSNTIEANGTVVSEESVELRPEVSGRLVYLNIPEGKRIAKGTVLARINDADIKAQIQKSKAQLDLAEKTAERYKKLAEIGGLSQSEYDIATSQIATIKADINYQYAQLQKTIIRAPFSGVIGLRNVSAGAYVSPQTLLATIQKNDQVKIDFTLPQNYTSQLKTGDKVRILTSGNKDVSAVIVAIEPQIETSTRNIKIRAVVQNEIISPGSFVKVYIEQSNLKPSILVPGNAIIPEANGKKLIVVKEGKANLVKIVTGARKESLIAVEEGIEPGDSVVVNGVLFAKPGSPVKVRNVVDLNSFKNN